MKLFFVKFDIIQYNIFKLTFLLTSFGTSKILNFRFDFSF